MSLEQRRLIGTLLRFRQSIASSSREVVLLFCSHCWCQPWSTVLSSELPISKETWMYWRELSEGLWRWLRDWSIFPMRKGWENLNCSVWRRGHAEGSYQDPWRKDAKRTESDSFTWCSMTGPTETQDTPSEYQEILLYCEGDWTLALEIFKSHLDMALISLKWF